MCGSDRQITCREQKCRLTKSRFFAQVGLMLTNSDALNECHDPSSALYDLQEASRSVLAVHAPLAGHAHHNTPAHPSKTGGELIRWGVPQRLRMQPQKDNGCQSLHTHEHWVSMHPDMYSNCSHCHDTFIESSQAAVTDAMQSQA